MPPFPCRASCISTQAIGFDFRVSGIKNQGLDARQREAEGHRGSRGVATWPTKRVAPTAVTQGEEAGHDGHSCTAL